MDMTEELTDYVLRNKGAKQTPDLKSFNSKYKWNVYDKLLHRQSQRITDREANIMFRKHIIESQNRINYRNEFDRLHGIYYANPNLPAPTKQIIKDRQKTFARISNEFVKRTRYYRPCGCRQNL